MPDPSNQSAPSLAGADWPALPYEEWRDTYETLHMWTQIVGKIRLTLSPMVNHWWQTTLYVTPRGLTTSPVPYGYRTFEIDFDFIDHTLAVQTSDGQVRYMGLHPRAVADFYRELMAVLRSLGIEVTINTLPQEVANPIACDIDTVHAAYDEEYVERLRHILVNTDSIFKEFRGRFLGKASPVHFFWGAFDLAVTRFSGRRAPERAGADHIQREAYSHECNSAGFWPGSGSLLEPAYYAYMSPVLPGIETAPIQHEGAYFNRELGEFILPYDVVRRANNPRETLLEFLQSAYGAAADLANWDRSSLERQ